MLGQIIVVIITFVLLLPLVYAAVVIGKEDRYTGRGNDRLAPHKRG